MEFVNGEYLDRIESSVARNVSCCRYAMDSKKKVGILAKGEYNIGTISRVWWDDMEDLISLKTDTGKDVTLSGSQISIVRLVEE